MTQFFCPHCLQRLALSDARTFPPVASSCPSCDLIIDAGEAVVVDSRTQKPTRRAAGEPTAKREDFIRDLGRLAPVEPPATGEDEAP